MGGGKVRTVGVRIRTSSEGAVVTLRVAHLADGGGIAQMEPVGITNAAKNDRAPGVEPCSKAVGCFLNDLMVGKGLMKDIFVFGQDVVASVVEGGCFTESLVATCVKAGGSIGAGTVSIAAFSNKDNVVPDGLGNC